VLRLRLSPLAWALRLGALLAPLGFTAAESLAESGNPLFQPELTDPRGARLQKVGRAKDGAQTTSSTFQPASGAGNTGFDSTGARKRKGKGKDKDKAGQKAKAELPSRYGSPQRNPLAPANLPVPRLPTGVERRGASPYYIAPDPAPDAPPLRRRLIPDETPFDPIGARVGSFIIKPAVELTGGYDTNPARTLTKTPSLYWVVAPEFKFNSNWSRHEFTGDLRGSYSAYEELPSQNRPAFDGKLNGRIDVTRDTRIDLETKFIVGTDNPGSPNIQAGLARLPVFTTFGGSAGLGHRFNRLEVSAKGGAERTIYQDSTFTDGTTASNEDRNYNRYFTQLRGSYELTPGVKPFVEAGADRRVHDLSPDVFGFFRNSDGGYVKAGSSFELTRLVTGEAAIGWLQRHYEDARLRPLSGLTVDASLVWVASALTTFRLSANTRADETTVPGVSGVFTREVALQVDHAFRRWLVATLRFTRGFDDYVGSDREDDRYSASAALTYKLTRELHLKSELRRDWLRSSVPAADYTANIVLLGVRIAR
jgi:hypothetical protein